MSNDSDQPSARLHVGRNLTGQAVVGDGNTVIWRQQSPTESLTPADVAQLRQSIVLLGNLVDEQPSQNGDAAKVKLAELQEAVLADRPDLATLEHVEGWFARRLPRLSAAVKGLIVGPLVTKFVAAAGDDLVTEFHRRFHG